jgi:hypothetical protein
MDAVDQLLAIERIKQLKARYFRFMDTKDWEGMRTIWTEDAVFDARAARTVDPTTVPAGDESATWIYSGGDNIVEFIRSVVVMPTAHHGHCHEIEVLSATDARGIIAMEDRIWAAPGATQTMLLHGYGHYHEEYRCVAGHWKIRRSRITRLNVTASAG